MTTTLLDGTVIQSLPDGFATTLRNRVLDAGTRLVTHAPLFFDLKARQLGSLVATENDNFIRDLKRDFVLVAESQFLLAVLANTKQTLPR